MPITKSREEYKDAYILHLSERNQEIFKKWVDGKTYVEIGTEYNLSRQRIEQIIKLTETRKSTKTLRNGPYRNLAEIIRNSHLNLCDIALGIGTSPSILSIKLSGESEFLFSEMRLIKAFLRSELELEELFKKFV